MTKNKDLYILTPSDLKGIKPHFCSSYLFAQEVAENIKKRYKIDMVIGSITPQSVCKNNTSYFPLTWDGLMGSVYVSDPFLTMYFSKYYLSFRKMHLAHFKNEMKACLNENKCDNKYDGKFYKIYNIQIEHSPYNGILCLNKLEKSLFEKEIKNI